MIKNVVNTPYYEFFKLEKEMELFTFKYKGVYYWQLIRFGLLKGITTKDLNVVSNGGTRNFKNEIFKTIQKASKMKTRYEELSKIDIVQLRPCVSITSDGKPDDHQFDYALLQNKYNVLDLYALAFYVEENTCVDYDMSPAEKELVLWKIKRKLIGESNISKKQEDSLRKFLCEINEIYGTNYSFENLKSQIQYAVKCHLIYKKWFIKIFISTKPKLLIEYPHYDEHMFAATEAAKGLGIKVLELQHGRINAHEAYWYEDKNPIGKTLPDYFLTYGDWWNNQISLPEFCKVVSVGNAYLEKQVKTYQREKKDHLVVSVFSNPQNGKTLLEFINSIQEYCVENNIEILYKLHPNESKVWKTEYPMLLKLRNTTIYDSGSVYSVLSQSDVVIGINSTVFFEALAYEDLHIYIYTIGDYEGMKPLLENNMATAVRTPEEFIANLSRIGSGDISTTLGDSLWKGNANENINIALQSIFESCKY